MKLNKKEKVIKKFLKSICLTNEIVVSTLENGHRWDHFENSQENTLFQKKIEDDLIFVRIKKDFNYEKNKLNLIKKLYSNKEINKFNEILLTKKIILKWENTILDKKIMNFKLNKSYFDCLNEEIETKKTLSSLFDELTDFVLKEIEKTNEQIGRYGYKLRFCLNEDVFLKNGIKTNKENNIIIYENNINNDFENKAINELKSFIAVKYAFSDKKISSMVFFKNFHSELYKGNLVVHYTNKKKQEENLNPYQVNIEPNFKTNYIYDINVSNINDWYNKFNSLEIKYKNRIKVASSKLNDALIKKNGDRFDEISKAIDAMFGIQGKVGKSINKNLENIIEKYNYKDFDLKKLKYFWEIRNHIAHGEIISLIDYKDYVNYYLKFNSCPEDDYIDLAFFCLKNLVDYFDKNYFLESF